MLSFIACLFIVVGLWELLFPKAAFAWFETLIEKHGLRYLGLFYAFAGVLLFAKLKTLSISWMGLIMGAVLVIVGLMYVYFDQHEMGDQLEDLLFDEKSLASMAKIDGAVQLVIGLLVWYLK